jgi:hypothetical protein
MTADVWAAWLLLLLAPWLAVFVTLWGGQPLGRWATLALGVCWCVGSAVLWLLLDRPVSISGGEWLVLPGSQPVAATSAWTISREALLGLLASGATLWWLSADEREDHDHVGWLLVQVLCGVAALVWFVDNVWWLLVEQAALLMLSAWLVGWQADGTPEGAATRTVWRAGARADVVLVMALLTAATALGTMRLTELSDPARLAALSTAAPGVIELVGLLWWLALCGRLFLFPLTSARDAAARSSPLVFTLVWGVALWPVAARWLFAGRAWWLSADVLTDLVIGWSALAAVAALWCALATTDLRQRLAWLLGVPVMVAVGPLMLGSAAVVLSEQWLLAACATAWLSATVTNSAQTPPRAARWWEASAIWLAVVNLLGLTVWPLSIMAGAEGASAIDRPLIGVLSGFATVLFAADASRGGFSPREWWGWWWLIGVPLLGVAAFGVTGAALQRSFDQAPPLSGIVAVVSGVFVGLLWQTCPVSWQQKVRGLLEPLVQLGRQRFSLPQMASSGMQLSWQSLVQLSQFVDQAFLSGVLWGRLHRQPPEHSPPDDLASATPEFYALALSLAAAAVTLTVMWLGG